MKNKENRCQKYEKIISGIEDKYDWYTEEILVINCGDDKQSALETEKEVTNLLKKETIIYGS